MEIFFLEGLVCWRHERAKWEYEARSRNWIWLDKFISYVIKKVINSRATGGLVTLLDIPDFRFLSLIEKRERDRETSVNHMILDKLFS